MALISANTIITSLSLFHITLGYFFLTSPVTVADQSLVFVMGEAMGMPYARSFDAQSPALAFLAVVLAFIGFADLASLSMPEEVAMVHHWGIQGELPRACSFHAPGFYGLTPDIRRTPAPLRLTLSMILLLYTLLFSASSPLYADSRAGPRGGVFTRPRGPHPGYAPSSWGGDGLKNRVFFTFIFLELLSWFWVWVTLREERKEIETRKAMRRRGSHGSHRDLAR
ncbi:hypothetical protein RB595_010533 [Gaeumannomyces hyphopodioides]